MSTITVDAKNNTHREELASDVGEFIVHFGKVAQVMQNGSKRVQLVVEKNDKASKPKPITLWLQKDEKMPEPRAVIHALIERTKVTRLDTGREFINEDVRTWIPT